MEIFLANCIIDRAPEGPTMPENASGTKLLSSISKFVVHMLEL